MSEFRKNSKMRKEKKPLSHGWIVVPSKTYPDRVYFYNTVTKCSSWVNPCESTDSGDYNDSSSETSVERRKPFKTINFSEASCSEKLNSKMISESPAQNSNTRINKDIDDYDEQQDQYFDNIPVNAFNLSHSNLCSPLSSPNSESSSKTNHSDPDQLTESNVLLEDNKLELWVHFVSSPEKAGAKKSVALSDFNEPCTSRNLGLELTEESGGKNSLLRSLSKDKEPNYYKNKNFKEGSKKTVNGLKGKKVKKTHLSKSVSEKTVKNVSFKVRDKTPAQTRLLKLRKQNAENLKKLTAKHSDLILPKKKNVDNKDNIPSVEEKTGEDNFGDTCLQRIELCTSATQDGSNHSKVDFCEEMDWEPSNEESDVKNINVFRQHAENTIEKSRDIFFGISFEHLSTLPSTTQIHSLFLVLDTNIFVSCLGFVKEIRDTKISDLGYPVIYVPWRVLQELDHLKDTKIDAVDKHIHVNVRKAITYLNENFKTRHPRIFGQSFEDYTKMVDDEATAPDDEILQTCIQFQKQHTNKYMILLTNDKNLESKAIVSGVEVYSKDRFQKKYMSSIGFPDFNSGLNSTIKRVKIDDSLCEIKAILKVFMSSVVETEMKIAFEGDWIKLAFKKPPFSCQDALSCLLKHWRSVFFVNFSKETHSEAEQLYEKLFKREAATSDDIVEIISTSQQLILSIKRDQKKKRPYLDLIPTTMTKLSNLLEGLSQNPSQADITAETPTLSTVSTINDSLIHTQQASRSEVSSGDVHKVKNLFKDIWDSLRSFCCSVSDVIHSSNANNEAVVQEIRLKLSQTLNEVEQFVITVKKIFEINPLEISDFHPLIIHFSNFLMRVYPALEPDLKNELPKSLAAFFTDFEGRSLLSSSLRDFKEFIHDLSKAMEYFSSHFGC